MMGQVIEMIAKSLKKGDKSSACPASASCRCATALHAWAASPQTGEPVKIKASKKIAFRAARISRNRSKRLPLKTALRPRA